MISGVYTAASGFLAQEKYMEILANNIANINTAGFKRQTPVFHNSVNQSATKRITISTLSNENLPLKIKLQRSINNIVLLDSVSTDLSEGPLKQTANKFDIAINGKGFFVVETSNGYKFTRQGSFTMDSKGRLCTQNGYLVMGKGPRNTLIPLHINGRENITVGETGNVTIDGTSVGKLKIVSFDKPEYLVPAGDSLYEYQAPAIPGEGQGTYPSTNPLHLAIRGRGFFTIKTPMGIRYTRYGNFKINGNSELSTPEGYPVLGENGPIKLTGKNIAINPNGNIIVDGNKVDRLLIQDFPAPYQLRSERENPLYFFPQNPAIAPKVTTGITVMQGQLEEPKRIGEKELSNPSILQGYLEESNVNPIKELVSMIQVLRTYESYQKLIQFTFTDTAEKLINETGRIT